jgi:hypothetical protein
MKVYDVIEKNFIPIDQKKILFSVNTLMSVFFQYFLIMHVRDIFSGQRSKISIGLFYRMAVLSLTINTILFIFLISQLFVYDFYFSSIVIYIISISYGTALFFIISLGFLFLSWFTFKRDYVVFLYFLSMLLIAFNLIITVFYAVLIIDDRPSQIGEFVGGSMAISGGRYILSDTAYEISSIASFGCIWLTTAIIIVKYKTRLLNTIAYGVALSLPLVYFIFNYTYLHVFGSLLTYYLTIDPITVSIMLIAFLSFSKPVGGLTFGFVFWKISRDFSYERNIKKYMVISGLGVFLLFAANQAIGLTLIPFPPFGLVTTSVISLAGLFTLLGIFNTAKFVSTNNTLQQSIHKRADEARLMGAIGGAEKDKELNKAIVRIMKDTDIISKNSNMQVDLDHEELKKYFDFVLTETGRKKNADVDKES